MLIGDGVVGDGQLAQCRQFTDKDYGFTADLVASDVKTFQFFQFWQIYHSLV